MSDVLKGHDDTPALRAGVLIIGSLWWDDRNGRGEWRSDRLDLSRARLVRARIRYGRLSKGTDRAGTYTMTFSGSADIGTAYAVPFRQRLRSFTELDTEVRALAAAEGFKDVERWPQWGAVGLLLRGADAFSSVADIAGFWAEYFRAHAHGSRVPQLHGPNEKPQIDAQGCLTIEWPQERSSGEPLEFDLLLATANTPDVGRGRFFGPPGNFSGPNRN